MKIDGNSHIARDIQIQQQEQTSQDARTKTEDSKTRQDRLELSVTSQKIKSLAGESTETSEVHAERVAEIKAQVEAGTYNIRAEKIAESIITGALVDKSA